MMNKMNRLTEDEMTLVSGGTTAAEGEPKFLIGDYVQFLDFELMLAKGHVTGYNAFRKAYEIDGDDGQCYVMAESELTLVTVANEGGISGGW